MALLSNISYGVQLFAAELIFLYAFPRRRVFPPRIALALAAILAVSFCVKCSPAPQPHSRAFC